MSFWHTKSQVTKRTPDIFRLRLLLGFVIKEGVHVFAHVRLIHVDELTVVGPLPPLAIYGVLQVPAGGGETSGVISGARKSRERKHIMSEMKKQVRRRDDSKDFGNQVNETKRAGEQP